MHCSAAAGQLEETSPYKHLLMPACEQETCCQGQHTYVHAQQMLTALAAHAKGARFKRLSQELEAHAALQQGPAVWQMHAWCATGLT